MSRIRAWWCERCRKTGHRRQIHARAHIAAIVRAPLVGRPDPFLYVLKPYRCPHGLGWHIGHDWHLVTWLAEQLEKRRKKVA